MPTCERSRPSRLISRSCMIHLRDARWEASLRSDWDLMTTPEDKRIQLANSGDADALSALLKEHGPSVEGLLRIDPAWRSTLDPLDVMQVTYMEAFLRIRSFDPKRGVPFVAWLRAIAENNLRDAIRGLTRQKRPPPRAQLRANDHSESLVGLYNLLAAKSASPSAKIRRTELCRIVETAIAALPDRYAQVVRWYDIDGDSIEEVMQKSGRSSGAVYMLRARAHQRLRELLGTESQFFG